MGSLESWALPWLTVLAVGLSPMLMFFVANVLGRILRRRRWLERRLASDPAETEGGERLLRQVEAPQK